MKLSGCPCHFEFCFWQGIHCIYVGAGIAQLVEHLTEKPSAILTWIQVLSVARDFSPKVSDSVHTAPMYNRMHQHLCDTLKIPNTGSHTIVLTHENNTHTDMGNAALWLLCLTQVRRPRFPTKAKEVLEKKGVT